MLRSKPPYPAEFRQQIVELVRAGRTPNEQRSLAALHRSSGTGWRKVRSMRASRCLARKA